ncbi:VWFA domain-containing protein [Rubrivivax sp. A210]|uniref:nitric oxide reductase activation protein NorD n=1 Tax=Rubrivivax sp. A210 TaxID=2772301 RepID=UPI0019193E07|nr:VWA domain-containing protein [Rubrivivax sp. A210]CAD5371107.1 VWFA domain-containing protein [Rubrivivax sp. A210]
MDTTVRPQLQASGQPLAQWLRLLWNAAPPLHLDSASPFIADGSIHLPAQPRWQLHCAAAAHAAAHLVYSPRRFAADGLVPTARALLALLEDARVEALAMRELPGLARLWRPLHTATPASGHGCEALMARLARALADPGYPDPHPWVAKGRRLFFLDEGLGLPALRTPAELRTAAMRLGHDLGQMRLPFNAKAYRPAPAYRDDHRWMWAADQQAAVQPPPLPQPLPADARTEPDRAEAPLSQTVTHHPEWDRLIQRLRPDWTRVIEQALPTAVPPPPHTAPREAAPEPSQSLSRRLLAPLQALARPLAPRGRAADGERFHLDALLAWRIARRCGQPGDARLYRARQPVAARSTVWLLVDRSASTAAPLAGGGPARPSVLQVAAQGAAATAQALQALGVPCAVAAFQSSGRQAVRLQLLQGPGAHDAGALLQRLQALQPGGSTRLGAVLRHATARLCAGRQGARWVLLVFDGQPSDVDVHDPHYLVDDARHAVQAARRRGVRMACLTLAEHPAPQAQRIFGRAGTQTLADLPALPRALRRLMA